MLTANFFHKVCSYTLRFLLIFVLCVCAIQQALILSLRMCSCAIFEAPYGKNPEETSVDSCKVQAYRYVMGIGVGPISNGY